MAVYPAICLYESRHVESVTNMNMRADSVPQQLLVISPFTFSILITCTFCDFSNHAFVQGEQLYTNTKGTCGGLRIGGVFAER